ncbi:sulfurtransferase TusA [Halioxenophilus sp. WMMB6]|uniref:sulfurtransferase TusA n=1 Tax=Halioxenophilus sp. WMMB6 TaxID=3073815 RepID=UPI00295F168A|nr:sulfurtransferase TusA [Halioxenophilus sp. WMMB6]
MTNEPKHDYLLDASGLLCPEPIMMLHNAVRDVAEGQVIKMISTDPSTQRDLNRFCEFLGHELLFEMEADGTFYFWLKKV